MTTIHFAGLRRHPGTGDAGRSMAGAAFAPVLPGLAGMPVGAAE